MAQDKDFLDRLFDQVAERAGVQVITGDSTQDLFAKIQEALGNEPKQDPMTNEEFLEAWTPDQALIQALKATVGAQLCFAQHCQDPECYGFKAEQADRWIELAKMLQLRLDRREQSSDSNEDAETQK